MMPSPEKCIPACAGEGITSATLTAEIPKCRSGGGEQSQQPWPMSENVRLRSRISVDDRRCRRLRDSVCRQTRGRCGRREVEAGPGLYRSGRPYRRSQCGGGSRTIRPRSDVASRVRPRSGRYCGRRSRCRGRRLRRRRRGRLSPAGNRAVDREVAKLGGSDGVLGSRRRRRDGDGGAARRRTLILSPCRRSDTHCERNGRRTYTQS